MLVTKHFPPDYKQVNDFDPLGFLAGPIQGAPNWQKHATETISMLYEKQAEIGSHLQIANPRREYLGTDFDWDAQVEWEEVHLERAARNGAILFWLAKQDLTLPYEQGRAYGQTTRFEFGEAIGWKKYDPTISIVLGIEPGYIGSERYYRKKAAKFEDIVVTDDLDIACAALVKTIKDRD
jgi:hypothetical protein